MKLSRSAYSTLPLFCFVATLTMPAWSQGIPIAPPQVSLLVDYSGNFIRPVEGGLKADGQSADPCTVFTLETFGDPVQYRLKSACTNLYIGIDNNKISLLPLTTSNLEKITLTPTRVQPGDYETLHVTNGTGDERCYIAFEKEGEPVTNPCQISGQSPKAAISIDIIGEK